MKFKRIMTGKGFALIEALIAFGVVAVGLLALAPLYSDMMTGSGLSKARAEALEAARGQNEILRNFAQKTHFDANLVNGTRNWTGKNASFTMTWTVTNPTGGPKYKNVMTVVTWTDPQEGAQEVRLPTQIHFNDPALSSAIQENELCANNPSECIGSLKSPWIAGKEGLHPSTADQTQIGSDTIDDLGTSSTSDDITIRSYSGGNVEVINSSDEVKLTAFGGIVHRIKGKIWLSSDARSVIVSASSTSALQVIASSPSYCVFPICEPSGTCTSGVLSASYICYIPGDCTQGGAGCPASGVLDAAFYDKKFAGGWYGSVGNFSVYLDPDDAVCTQDTNIAGGSALRLTPSRQYAAFRVTSSGTSGCTTAGVVSAVENRRHACDSTQPFPWTHGTPTSPTTCPSWPDYRSYQPEQRAPIGPVETDFTRTYRGFCVAGSSKTMISTEGINTPFSNQDFVIVRKNRGCNDLSRIPGLPANFCLPPSSIGRALYSDTTPPSLNQSLPENRSYASCMP